MKHHLTTLILAACLALPVAAQRIDLLPPYTGAQVTPATDSVLIRKTDAVGGQAGQMTIAEMWKALGGTNVSTTELGYLDGVTGAIQPQIAAKETALGNPGTSGHVLSSTTGGTRSWIAPGGTWGSITGTLGSQTDLNTSLNSKAGKHITFYDRFDDISRYANNALITTNVSSPKFGNAWRIRHNSDVTSGAARVVNGRLQTPRGGGYYLSANVTPVDHTDFSMGVEFIREATFLTASSNNHFTLAIGQPDLVVADGSGIQINGNPHVNMDQTGVATITMSFNVADASGTASADIFTTVAPHGFESYDLVGVAGTLPSGLSASVNYYIIKLTSTTFQLALTRADVATPTVVSLGAGGGTVNFTRAAECLNRPYLNGYHSWLPAQAVSYLCSRGGNFLYTTYNHGMVTGDAFTLEGSGLPSPLAERTVYYAIYNGANNIAVAATPGGSAITLTTAGSANQLIRTVNRNLISSIPYGRRSIMTFRVRGDYFQISLEGVGTVEYYYRNLATKIPANMSFYFQTPPSSSSGGTFSSTYASTAVWVDAPKVEEEHVRRLPGYLTAAVGDTDNRINGPLTVLDSKLPSMASLMWPNIRAKASFGSGASSLLSLGNSINGNVGGDVFADGYLTFNPGFTEFSAANQKAFAPGTWDAVMDTEVASSAGSLTTVTKSILCINGLTVGSMQEFELCGYMEGVGNKQLLVRLNNNTVLTTIFDSGSALNGLTVPWTLKILRKSTAANSHIMYATLTYNGLTIGPQRTVVNMATIDYRYMEVVLTTADARGLVLETVRPTLHPVKSR